MPRVLLIVFVIAVAFWVVSIVDCAVQPGTRHRGVNKPAWLAIVVLIPVIGGILWFVVGRTRRSTAASRRAPDDDPTFLSGIGTISDQDERIRRLEEELAQLDAEDEDPRWSPPAPTAGDEGGAAASDSADPRRTPPATGSAADDVDGDDSRGPRRGSLG